ncbi:hypothetical protein KIM372_05940 [Bombiscardovia nodaiensis]|uniref:Uncharacterized protein n=1 Tax=Bombiscardovia nodaiensis TaxID=2932181 RepID=A0ABM8B7H6_9BIFI|nr:hypothetical protein KIM372_05940 [Bombiscardovia nodaiensis]
MEQMNGVNEQPQAEEPAGSKSTISGWKIALAAALALVIGLAAGWGISAATHTGVKDSHEYRQLEREYTQTKSELKSTRRSLDDTKDALKDAQDNLKDERKQNIHDQHDQDRADQKAAKDAAKQAEKEQKEQRRAAEHAERNQQSPAPTNPDGSPLPTAAGGTFCTTEGAQALSDRSQYRILTCKMASDGHLRWKD